MYFKKTIEAIHELAGDLQYTADKDFVEYATKEIKESCIWILGNEWVTENDKLKEQIEKMKRCSNCKHVKVNFDQYDFFEFVCKISGCKGYSKWTINEV